jgi:signal transduction histidine kinase
VAAVYALPFGLHAAFVAVACASADGNLARLARLIPVSMAAGHLLPLLIGAVFVRGYRATRDKTARRRMRWVLYTFVAAALLYLGLGQVPSRLLGHPLVSWDWTPLFFLPCPLALGAAVLRHRLFDIDVILTRSLVYGGLTVVAVGVFLGVLAALGLVFGSGLDLAPLLAAAVAALGVQVLRTRLQRIASRMIYGARDDPQEVVTRLGRRLDTPTTSESVLSAVVDTLAQALRLPYVAIELTAPAENTGHPGEPQSVTERAEVGRPAGAPARIPLAHGGEQIGTLVLDAGPSREPFGAADRRLLETLARQVELTAVNVLLNRRLQRSLERVVTGREEERRRIRRDIHDGLGPTLAAVGMRLDVAQALVGRDPATAQALLAELVDTHRAVLADLRRLVDGLRPPALDQLGLVKAVERHARALDSTGVAESVSGVADTAGAEPAGAVEFVVEAAPELGELPAAVEIAGYRICLEAMTNVVRHAAARRCTVRLRRSDIALQIEVADDGVGLPPDHRSGVGLQSVRDRAAELGGTCAVTAGPDGGTVLRAQLPAPT